MVRLPPLTHLMDEASTIAIANALMDTREQDDDWTYRAMPHPDYEDVYVIAVYDDEGDLCAYW